MKAWLVVVLALIAGAGCTSDRLRLSTLNQATTLTDLQYQQVLSNVAMFCQNPAAMPWQVNLRDGSAQVADLGALTLGGQLAHASQVLPSLLGSRTVVEQWSMTPVTDDTEIRILRVAYRRALGSPESLASDGNDLANDLAHELKKQTPDFNEFGDQIDRTFSDGRTRFRNGRMKQMMEQGGWPGLVNLILFGETTAAAAQVADVLFPYHYEIEGYANKGRQQNATKPETYYDFLAQALSVVNQRIILDQERIADRVDPATKEKKFGYDNYIVNREIDDDPSRPIKNEYGYQVNLVTPFAAELRRQVKEVEKDMLEIGPGWYHVGRKRDVPKDACYVGHYRDCYVWVCREGLDDLTKFTIKILSFSSLIKDPSILSTPGPRFTPASSFPTL